MLNASIAVTMLLIRVVHFFTKVLGSSENGSNCCKTSLIKKGFHYV